MAETGASNRRLAAVMFLDMVGYSALMARSESSALLCVRDLEGLLRQEVPAVGGRLVKLLGDGSIAVFPTAGAALQCARRIVDAVVERNYEIRVGLHLGELLEEDGDIFGDAVNIAARVVPLADPGGIAMTGTFHAQVKNHVELRGAFLPPAKLKNIPDRISIFAVPPAGTSLTAWKVRRHSRLLAGAAAVLLLLVGAGLGLRQLAKPSAKSPTLTLFFVKTPDLSDEWKKRSREFDERMIFQGPNIRGFRWQERDLALAKAGHEALADFDLSKPGAETRACILLRDIGIDFAIYTHLKKGEKKKFKTEFALIDGRESEIVISETIEGQDMDELARGIGNSISAWAKTEGTKD